MSRTLSQRPAAGGRFVFAPSTPALYATNRSRPLPFRSQPLLPFDVVLLRGALLPGRAAQECSHRTP